MISSDNFIPVGKIKEVITLKLFEKKTLALFLALAMVMPMCVFATETTTPAADRMKRQWAGQSRRGNPVRKVRASQSRITDNIGRGRPPDKCNRNRPPHFWGKGGKVG